jgi:hypothetical protein
MVNTQINAAQSVQLRNIHVPTKGPSMLCEVGRDCYEGCLEGDICNESTWLCEIPQSYVVDTDCKTTEAFSCSPTTGMCHNCYHCSEDYACCNDDTYMCAEQQGQRYDTSFPKYSEGSSCNEITHQLCEIPTNDPTNIPTFTKVTQGSFEIHSIGDVTGEALSGTIIELLDMYNGSNRVHDTTVLSPDCITKFSGPVVAEAFQVETTPADVVSLGNK